MLETLDSKVTLFELAKLAMRALIARPTKAARSDAVASGEATVALTPLAEVALLAHRDRDASLASGARLSENRAWLKRGEICSGSMSSCEDSKPACSVSPCSAVPRRMRSGGGMRFA